MGHGCLRLFSWTGQKFFCNSGMITFIDTDETELISKMEKISIPVAGKSEWLYQLLPNNKWHIN